jgi:hypothetical protein
MDYGNVLSRAWQITWKHKVLWIFGILAGCSSGNSNFRGGGGTGGPGGQGPGADQFQQFFERPEGTAIIIAIVAVVLLIVVAVMVLSTIGRGGLIGGARLADEKGAVTFGEAWGIGVGSFWRLFVIGLLVVLPVIVLALMTAGAGLLAGPLALAFIPLLCLAILFVIPASIVAHFAQFAVVLDGLGVGAAFRKGWDVIKTNFGPVIVLGLILIVVGAIAGLIIAAPFIALLAPVLVGVVAGGVTGSEVLSVPFLVAAGIGFLCYLPFAIALSGILQTWTMSAWTLAYRRFTSSAPAVVTAPAQPA